MLVFKTVDDYMKAVDGDLDSNHERILSDVKKLNFANYFSEASNMKNSSKEGMDEFFGQLLNSNGCIEIENHVFRIDLTNERVFVIKKNEYIESKDQFLTATSENDFIKAFYLNEDVLDIIKNGTKSQEKCFTPGTVTSTSYTEAGFNPLIKNEIKLGAFGIYFRVTGRSTLLSSYNGYFQLEFILAVNNTQIHRKPCNNNDITWHGIGTKASWISPGNNEQVWEAYSKAWNVKQIYMRGKTRGTFGGPLDDGFLTRETTDALIVL